MNKLTIKEHLHELKIRIFIIILAYIVFLAISYCFSREIYNFLLKPLAQVNNENNRRIIYTSLTEGFFSYIKVAVFSATFLVLPVISIQVYLFIKSGLKNYEKIIAICIIASSPVLFWIGGFFVYFYVMPKAWEFFVSFESVNQQLPIVLEAKMNEYIDLVVKLIIAFGIAFQLPIILLIMNLLGFVSVGSLIAKRRIAIVVNFIIAGIITPPDVISQIALAIPMLLLYEIAIILCRFLEKRRKCNA